MLEGGDDALRFRASTSSHALPSRHLSCAVLPLPAMRPTAAGLRPLPSGSTALVAYGELGSGQAGRDHRVADRLAVALAEQVGHAVDLGSRPVAPAVFDISIVKVEDCQRVVPRLAERYSAGLVSWEQGFD
jgi:hypothetical protein